MRQKTKTVKIRGQACRKTRQIGSKSLFDSIARQEKIQNPKLRRCLDLQFLQLCWILNSQNLLVVFSSRNKTTTECTVGGSKQLTLISCSDDAYSVSSKFNILYRLFLKLFLAIFSRFPFLYLKKMHFVLLLVARTAWMDQVRLQRF
jgi:hypothetical protein